MKKIFFFSFLGLFFLAGCKPISNFPSIQKDIYPIIEQPKSFESILPKSTKEHIDTKTSISILTGKMLSEITSKVKNEISRTSNKEQKQNGRKESVVSGYIYTYIYQDLGLKISTPPLYSPYFFEKETGLILKRNNAIVYSSGSSDQGAEYIQTFTKDQNISFYNQIKQNHLPSGCKIDVFTGYNYNFLSKDSKMISVTFSDISFPKNTCTTQDITFPKNPLLIVFFYNPKHPEKYYKISFADGCAPGPCSIFGNIEFF